MKLAHKKLKSVIFSMEVVPLHLDSVSKSYDCFTRNTCLLTSDQGIKFCSKIQSARNCFKLDESVGLVIANPTQLISSQTDIGSERYSDMFIKSNKQKNLLLTVQSVQSDVAESYDRMCGDVVVYYWMIGGQMGR
jgi:hypothetical protein